MIPQRPYLLRAIYDWIVDNGWTPYIVLDTSGDDVEVPPGYASDGQVLLNVSNDAVRGLVLGSELVEFGARFGGVSHQVRAPVERVVAIFANENGEGMAFDQLPSGDGPKGDPSPSENGGPNLRVVK
ncbi:MAG: ClpXP protease specificity-enhancing factor [Pseudomonadales bacterium]